MHLQTRGLNRRREEESVGRSVVFTVIVSHEAKE